MKALISATVLEKIARHLALLACLAVLFKANGWSDTGQPAIAALAAVASVFHLGARWLKSRRWPESGR